MHEAPSLPSTAELLGRRVRYVAIAIVGSLSVSSVASYISGATVTAGATLLVVVLAGAVWLLNHAGRIPVPHAGAVIWVLWWAVVGVSFTASTELPSWAVDQWLAILFIGYAGVQLERRWIWAAYIPGALAWIFMIVGDADQPLVFRIVTVAGAVGLSGLAFVAQVAFVAETQRLRQRDLERKRELAEALARAEHELEERTRAEHEAKDVRARFEMSQRMQAIGTLAGGVAHELNNVLAGIMGIASLLQDDLTGTAQEDAAAIVASCERGAELTSALLVFGRRNRGAVAPTRIAAILDEIEPILRRACPVQATLRFERSAECMAAAVNRSELAQAIVNLAFNAFHACPAGTIVISVQGPVTDHRTPVEGPAVLLSVVDDGVGMDDETRQRAFEPFFTTKPVGEGTGLGLAQVYGAVTSIGGFVEARSTPNEGTTMQIWLPHCDPPEAIPTPERPRFSSKSRIALVVDDEPLVRRSTQNILGRAGYEVHLAGDANEAEAVAEAHEGRYDVALLDLRMPGRDGVELALALRRRWPTLRIVIYSGDVDQAARERLASADVHEILTKPLPADALIEVLERSR